MIEGQEVEVDKEETKNGYEVDIVEDKMWEDIQY